jgi:1,2-diacylglycerol 3-alpha-glucosyltransferase
MAVLWAQYGPYHFARAGALARLMAPSKVHAIELASRTRDYEWDRAKTGLNLITICPDAVAERIPFFTVFFRTRRQFARLGIQACFLPSYFPKQSLAALLAAKSLGIRAIMMNETHAGTARASGLGAWGKRGLIGLFDAALVGGAPQKRYFASIGLPEGKIFTGYDAVDNDHFAQRAKEVRGRAAELRTKHALPGHYFLSLGRFIAKKNLGALVRAYRQFLQASQVKQTHLVLVGSGEEEGRLRALCSELRLPIYDKTPVEIEKRKSKNEKEIAGVHFYGFRQIDENPLFYGLADAFILPSIYEEWGLVVNEAMASGLPVIVSQTAGCAEDLLEMGQPVSTHADEAESPRPNLPAQLNHLIRSNGFVFDPASSIELSSIMLSLESLPAMRGEMARESSRIVEKFSCSNFAENALEAAKVAMGRKPGPLRRDLDNEPVVATPMKDEAAKTSGVSPMR